METKDLHSSARPGSDPIIRSSRDEDAASESGSFRTARQSSDSTSSSLEINPTHLTSSSDPDSAAYLQSSTNLGRQRPSKHSDEASARRDPTTNPAAAQSQTTKKMIPDRTAKPLGGPHGTRQRRPPLAISSDGELLISSSLGESPPTTQSSKRPLPDSPTSQLQLDNPTRRRQHVRETPSREEIGSSSRSGKKDSHKQRSRA